MNAKHTLGPWRVSKRNPRIIVGNGPGWVGVAKVGINGTTAGKIDADARLIAAAPELLTLLYELIDIEGPQPGTSAWANKARAIIAKATGETP